VSFVAIYFHSFVVGTSPDMLSGASPSDQVDFVSLASGMNHPFPALNRSRSKSCLEMKFPSPQPQPDMLPEFDHQQQTSPQVGYVSALLCCPEQAMDRSFSFNLLILLSCKTIQISFANSL
jgi:hypothetical protein